MSAVLEFNPRDDANIDTFIKLNEVKNNYWKSYKLSRKEGDIHPELMVNLGNALKDNIVYLNHWIIMIKL